MLNSAIKYGAKARTSICIAKYANGKIQKKCWTQSAKVKFKKVENKEIEKYLSTKKYIGKAGGFNIAQKPISNWVDEIEGDKNTIVGLPLQRLKKELKKFMI